MTKFSNTNIFKQIDWELEIVTAIPKEQEQLIDLTSTAVHVWSLAQQTFLKKLQESEELNVKSNCLRCLEYFFSRFVYFHNNFYGKENCDLKEVLKSYKHETHILLKLKKQYPNLQQSRLPLKYLQQIEKIFAKQVEKYFAKDIPKGGYYNQGKKLLEKCDLKVHEPTWMKPEFKSSDRDTYFTLHTDQTLYSLYLMRDERTLSKVKTELKNHHDMIAKYHKHILKPIYDIISKISELGNVWIMEGGGAQCQAFFGNDQGYIGTLYLDMKSNSKKEITGPRDYTFTCNGKRSDDIFKNIKLPNCKILLCREIYKDNLETINYYGKD